MVEHRLADQARRRPAGHLGRADHHVGQGQLFAELLALGLQEGLAGRLGIAALLGRGGHLLRRRQEATPQGFHLLAGRRAHIAHRDHRPQPPGRGHRLQPGHTGPQDQGPGRLDRAGRGHQHGHVAVEG